MIMKSLIGRVDIVCSSAESTPHHRDPIRFPPSASNVVLQLQLDVRQSMSKYQLSQLGQRRGVEDLEPHLIYRGSTKPKNAEK